MRVWTGRQWLHLCTKESAAENRLLHATCQGMLLVSLQVTRTRTRVCAFHQTFFVFGDELACLEFLVQVQLHKEMCTDGGVVGSGG